MILSQRKTFWAEVISQQSPVELPADWPRPPMQGFVRANLPRELTAPLSLIHI